MNENIDLTKILKNCPKGWKFYSTIFGKVKFNKIEERHKYPIVFTTIYGNKCETTAEGKHQLQFDGECTLFPSQDQRDWSKFTAPWHKRERFDPNTLKPFDKVLVKISNESYNTWFADFVAEPAHVKNETPLILGAKEANMVIPYNDETKHLVGTTEEAPEYYRYWED